MTTNRLVLAVILLLIFVVFPETALNQNLAVNLIPDSLKKNVNSVVRYRTKTIEIDKAYDMKVDLSWAITVLNASGEDDLYMGNEYSKSLRINSMQARIFDAEGKEIKKLKSADLIDMSAVNSGSVFVDSRLQFYTYKSGSFPYTVVFSSSVTSKSSAFIPDWNPLSRAFQSVELNEFTLVYPPEWDLTKTERNFEAFGVVSSSIPGLYNAKIINTKPLAEEYASPAADQINPFASFSLNHFQLEGIKGKAESWNDFGRWYSTNFLTGNDEIPPATLTEVRKLVEGCTDSVEMAKKIYHYVQSRTRYVNVSIGIGGWKPMKVSEVDELKYGDCKALSFYTQSLLKSVGLPATYTIIYAGSGQKSLDTNQISVQGNHVIVSIPLKDTTIWLETTSQQIPFGFLGDFTDNRLALSLSEKGAFLVKTPAYADTINLQTNEASVDLDADGSITSELKTHSYGLQYNDHYRLKTLKTSDLEKHYQSHWNYLQGLKLHEMDLDEDKEQVIFEEKILLEAVKYGSQSGERMLVPVNFFNRLSYIPPRIASRKHPIVLRRGYLDKDICKLKIPEGYGIEALPKDINLDSPFGTYELRIEKTDEYNLKIHRRFLAKSGTFEAGSYQDYVQFRKDISKFDQSKIILKKL